MVLIDFVNIQKKMDTAISAVTYLKPSSRYIKMLKLEKKYNPIKINFMDCYLTI